MCSDAQLTQLGQVRALSSGGDILLSASDVATFELLLLNC